VDENRYEIGVDIEVKHGWRSVKEEK